MNNSNSSGEISPTSVQSATDDSKPTTEPATLPANPDDKAKPAAKKSTAKGKSVVSSKHDQQPVMDSRHEQSVLRHDPAAIRELFLTGEFPYKNKIGRKDYEQKKAHLQVELLKVQRWVKDTGQKIVVLFEGRDAAGKGGTIKRFMEHLNPRGARVVALEKPTEQESEDQRGESAPSHDPHTVARVTTDRNCEFGPFDGTYRENVSTCDGYLHTAV